MHTHITVSETSFTQAGLLLLTRGRDWTRPQTTSHSYIPGFLLEAKLPNWVLQWFNHSCTSDSCWISQRPLGEAELQHNCGPFRNCFASLWEQTMFASHLLHSSSNNLALMREKPISLSALMALQLKLRFLSSFWNKLNIALTKKI